MNNIIFYPSRLGQRLRCVEKTPNILYNWVQGNKKMINCAKNINNNLLKLYIMENLTKKQIISQIKMNKVKPYIKQNNITRKRLNNFLKERLIMLFYFQTYWIDILDKFKVPMDIQIYILKYV